MTLPCMPSVTLSNRARLGMSAWLSLRPPERWTAVGTGFSSGGAGVVAPVGSHQHSPSRRGLGSVGPHGPPPGSRPRASGGLGVVAEAERHPGEDLAVRAHRIAADRTEEPSELERGVTVYTGPDSFAGGGDVVDDPAARVDADVDTTEEGDEGGPSRLEVLTL
jgi:hypothetical protein